MRRRSSARSQISGLIESKLSTPEQKAQVEGLAGLLPFDVKVGTFRLSDAEGPWLEVDNARVTLSPTDLLAGRILLKQVGADRVALNRLPPSQPAPQPQPKEPFRLPKLPELPDSLPTFALDHLYVHALEIAAPVLGQAATFSLDGGAATKADGKQLDARLDLQRTDQKTASVTLDAGLDLATKALDVTLKGQETGGLLAAATHRPEAGDLSLSLVGKGPLTDWQADLDVDAQNLGSLKSHLAFGYAELPRLALTGSLTTAPGALPADLQPLLGNDVELAVRLQPTSGDELALQQLSLQAKGVQLSGIGQGGDRRRYRVGPDQARAARPRQSRCAGQGQARRQGHGRARRLGCPHQAAARPHAERAGHRLQPVRRRQPGNGASRGAAGLARARLSRCHGHRARHGRRRHADRPAAPAGGSSDLRPRRQGSGRGRGDAGSPDDRRPARQRWR